MIPDVVRYFDIRRVRGESTGIEIDNGLVETAGVALSDIAVIRVLSRKGFGLLTVTNPGDLKGAKLDEYLCEAARMAEPTVEEVSLAEVPSSIHPVPARGEDPRDLSLEEKTACLSRIEKAAAVPGVTNTRAGYTERYEEVTFLDSCGHEYHFTVCRAGFSVLAVASGNGTIQMAYERRHSLTELPVLRGEEDGRKAGERAVALISAKGSKGGRMRAVLDPELAGVFAHEAVGHAAEGDLVLEGSSVLGGRIGECIGPEFLTIIDDPTLPGFGFEPCDAEGSTVQPSEIIRNGVVHSYLHSRETLSRLGNGHAGHARAMAGDIPLVRMSNTYIREGDASREEIIEDCREGLLLIGSRGGQVDPGRGVFQFNAEYGYEVVNGEIAGMVRDVSLSGDILSTLHHIVLCGNERKMHPGYCGKGGQSVPVSDGAPYLLLDEALVGGNGTG